MSGKGDKPRPIAVGADEFASNWDAIFGNKQLGHSSTGRAASSNLASCAGSIPAAPANCDECRSVVHSTRDDERCMVRSIARVRCESSPVGTFQTLLDESPLAVYIDPTSGAQVDEHWWPGDPVGYGVG